MLDYDGEVEDISLGSPDNIADYVSSLLVKMRGCAAETKPVKGPRKSLDEVRSLLTGEFPEKIDEVLSNINELKLISSVETKIIFSRTKFLLILYLVFKSKPSNFLLFVPHIFLSPTLSSLKSPLNNDKFIEKSSVNSK